MKNTEIRGRSRKVENTEWVFSSDSGRGSVSGEAWATTGLA